MAGNLIIPRVEVYWGEVNLTSYNGDGDYPKGDPLVFKVECTLPQQADNPSGSMMWAPTAQAYKIYEDLLKNNVNKQIVTTFGYLGKKKISLIWVWGGNTYAYGNTMGIKVLLLSELSGLINSSVRSVANNADKGMTMVSAIKETEKSYAVKDLKLIKYTDTAKKDLESSKILTQYTKDTTFVSAVNNVVKSNGNYVFSTNIVSEGEVTDATPITGRTETASKLVIFTPYQHEKGGNTVLDGQSRGYDEFPDPTKRYGYLLGPSMINSTERSYQWAPPQQLDVPMPAKSALPTKPRRGNKGNQPPAVQQSARAAAEGGAVQGPSLAATNPGISKDIDKVGAEKQIFQQQEAMSKMSFNTFMVPALVGIKPYDIIYVPKLNAQGPEDIEDWIVNTVDYNQTDGGIDISVTASRTYGIGASLMNEANGTKFLEKAKKLTTLEKWEQYAWLVAAETAENIPDPTGGAVIPLPVVPPSS